MSSDKRQTTRENRAFTLFELLIATAVVGLILASVLPYVVSQRELSRRLVCADHLRQLRDAFRNYARDNGSYPRGRYDPAVHAEGYVAFTGPDAADPFAANSAVQPGDVTAALWLLVRNGYVKDTSVFVCPSSDDWADRLYDAKGAIGSAKSRGNFRSGHHLSYSVFCMYGSAVTNSWTDTLQSGVALLADKNPGVGNGDDVTKVPAGLKEEEKYAITNSRNHGRAGQNVLYAGGNVEFERTPYVGVGYARPKKGDDGNWSPQVNGDNIYTALSAKPLPTGQTPPADGPGVAGKTVGPAWPYDSFLVPTANDFTSAESTSR